MSTVYLQATQFQILDDSVTSQEETFDRLIKVRHTLSGKEGLLLCSHYSRWPSDLIDRADWLAGCYTPTAYLEDKRLVFGAIPNNQIQWSIDRDARTIVLQAGVFVNANGQLDDRDNSDGYGAEIVYVRAQTWAEPSKRIARRIKAVARMLLPGVRELSNYNRFKTVVEFLEAGAEFVSGEWHYVAAVLGLWENEDVMGYAVREEIGYFDWGTRMSKQTSEGLVCFTLDEEDYNFSITGLNEELPYTLSDNTLTVRRYLCDDAKSAGYAEAKPMEYYWLVVRGNSGHIERTVMVDAPEYGFVRAWDYRTAQAPQGSSRSLN